MFIFKIKKNVSINIGRVGGWTGLQRENFDLGFLVLVRNTKLMTKIRTLSIIRPSEIIH